MERAATVRHIARLMAMQFEYMHCACAPHIRCNECGASALHCMHVSAARINWFRKRLVRSLIIIIFIATKKTNDGIFQVIITNSVNDLLLPSALHSFHPAFVRHSYGNCANHSTINPNFWFAINRKTRKVCCGGAWCHTNQL